MALSTLIVCPGYRGENVTTNNSHDWGEIWSGHRTAIAGWLH
jgi:hypothetical protein